MICRKTNLKETLNESPAKNRIDIQCKKHYNIFNGEQGKLCSIFIYFNVYHAWYSDERISNNIQKMKRKISKSFLQIKCDDPISR